MQILGSKHEEVTCGGFQARSDPRLMHAPGLEPAPSSLLDGRVEAFISPINTAQAHAEQIYLLLVCILYYGMQIRGWMMGHVR